MSEVNINENKENKETTNTSLEFDNTENTHTLIKDELALLKERATKLGIRFNDKIGIDKLKIKINNKLNPTEAINEEDEDTTEKENVTTTTKEVSIVDSLKKEGIDPRKTKIRSSGEESKAQKIIRLRKEASKLIRIRVSCMNPNKKEHEGEIFTVSNSIVGTFRKYVPFNSDAGYHIPNIIYKHLLERKCQIFYTVKGPRGNKIRKGKLIKEFAIEVLPQLTSGELKDLATQQAMANNLD